MKWFKVSKDIIHDTKVRALSPEGRWTWITCLALAADADDNGALTIAGRPLPMAQIVDAAGLPADEVLDAIHSMRAMRMLRYGAATGLVVTNWERWQHSPAYLRVQAFRARKRAQDDADDPQTPPAIAADESEPLAYADEDPDVEIAQDAPEIADPQPDPDPEAPRGGEELGSAEMEGLIIERADAWGLAAQETIDTILDMWADTPLDEPEMLTTVKAAIQATERNRPKSPKAYLHACLLQAFRIAVENHSLKGAV